MRDSTYILTVATTNSFLRHRPQLFLEAASWIASFKPKRPPSRRKVTRSEAERISKDINYRQVQALILCVRAELDQGGSPPLESEQDRRRNAFRTLFAAWLMSIHARDSTYDGAPSAVDIPFSEPVPQLPCLDEEQECELAIRFALEDDPRWAERVLSAWKLVGDPRYFRLDAEPEHNRTRQSLTAPERAFASDRWARKMRPGFYVGTGTKYPQAAYDFIADRANGCPAYADRLSPPGFDSWVRNLREAHRLIRANRFRLPHETDG